MKDLYSIASISKQAVWKSISRADTKAQTSHQIVEHLNSIRREHKRMGCRKMYFTSQFPVGRDCFEQIAFDNGFKLRRKRNTIKTTWSQRIEVYPNLIEGIGINNINRVFQSDIFYLKVEQKDYYGICILDVYSRKLLALHVSQSLFANENVKALKHVIKTRSKLSSLNNCIFHSDRGSQYISKVHKELLRANKMKISMCKIPQENAYVERMNGIIKNEYFHEMTLTQANIQRKTKQALNLYNNHRPHSRLNMMTPTAFEHYVTKLEDKQRPEHTIYKWTNDLSTIYRVVNKEKSNKKEI